MVQPIRVMLIEDNPADAELTRETLESGRLHVQIDHQPSGVAALEQLIALADNRPTALPDLILLDLNLPQVPGTDVLVEIRRDDRLRKLPVVVLTSSDAERDIVQSYELGANCYVTKPVGLPEFQAIVRSVEDFWFTVVKLP